MIVIMRAQAGESDVQRLADVMRNRGLEIHPIFGEERIVVGLVGDVRTVPVAEIERLAGVDRVIRIMTPFKLASREVRSGTTRVQVGDSCFGSTTVHVIAGPCAVEDRDTLMRTARSVREAGATLLRGGAFKPRTSPYSFQGLGREGLELLAEARAATGMPVVTEVVRPEEVAVVGELADMLQVGARNMQNFSLLQELGRQPRPVLLKRGPMASIEEWLLAAEYVLAEGNDKVVLCERGIRTFETATRNTLDLSSIPVIRGLTHLPVIVDPSHGTGRRDCVGPMSLAAVAAGADGLLLEVHAEPDRAWSDGKQSLCPEQFSVLMRSLEAVARSVGREVAKRREERVIA